VEFARINEREEGETPEGEAMRETEMTRRERGSFRNFSPFPSLFLRSTRSLTETGKKKEGRRKKRLNPLGSNRYFDLGKKRS